MPGGAKEMKVNTLERAISTDINRLQRFQGAAMAELMRYMLDVTGDDDLNGGVVTEHTTVESPLRAEIINGLMVKPQSGAGVFDLLVSPGVMLAVAPDGDADASLYKYVDDPGVASLGLLTMSGGSGGATRIDVVECQVSSVTVETSNRDVFNPATGTFTSTSVTKATQYTCTFVGGATNIRVRQGTPGAGFPGTVSGWLPLAVASVPSTATSNDQITFWDVRPLVEDREFIPFATKSNSPRTKKSRFSFILGATAGGWVDAVANGRRLGGRIRDGFGVADAETMNLTSVGNQEGAGISTVTHQPWFLYLLTPFGLPRWQRYSGAAPRAPRNPRGIPVLSMVGPDADGNPSAPITLPNSPGLGGTSQVGLCVGAGWCNGAVLVGFHGDETGLMLTQASGQANISPIRVNPVANGVDPIVFNLTPNTHYPASAKALYVEFSYTTTDAAGPFKNQVIVMDPTNSFGVSEYVFPTMASITGLSQTISVSGWVTLPPVYPSVTPPAVQAIQLLVNNATPADNSAAAMRVLGWRL